MLQAVEIAAKKSLCSLMVDMKKACHNSNEESIEWLCAWFYQSQQYSEERSYHTLASVSY